MAQVAGLGVARPLQLRRPMRNVVVVVAVVLLAVSAAHADQPVALAVNAPLSWGRAISGSAYARLAPHDALRINVASYEHRRGMASALATMDDGGESTYSGRTLDIGIGWQYFPRRVWDGFVFEAGVLRRGEDHTTDEARWNGRIEHRKATGYAARVMVGWSWLLGEHIFIAASVGLSLGRYTGTESVQRTDDSLDPTGMPMLESFAEDKIEGEAYLRIGVPFGT